MPSIVINSERFWDLYFRNLFLDLQRSRARYIGLTFVHPEYAHPPLGLAREPGKLEIEIPFNELSQYGYEADGRFNRIDHQLVDIKGAYDEVIAFTYPFREPAPFGKARMAELFHEISLEFFPFTGTPHSVADLEQALREMLENFIPALNQHIAALSWFLGERRQRSSAKVLLAVIENSALVLNARLSVHFTAVDAAFSALWKVNNKEVLWELLDVMREVDERGRRKIAPLFERLLSTRDLLSLEHCGDMYLDPGFWSRTLEPYRKYTFTDWDQYDVDALFWEIRYLAALRLPKGSFTAIRKLAADEVGTVRAAALARL